MFGTWVGAILLVAGHGERPQAERSCYLKRQTPGRRRCSFQIGGGFFAKIDGGFFIPAKSRENFMKIGLKNGEFDPKIAKLTKFAAKITKTNHHDFLLNSRVWSGAKECKSCRSRKN